MAELALEPGVDTLARWMAHHVAELILRAERAEGADAEAARRECVDTILALWRHRAVMPGHRPLEDFEPILRLLDALAKPSDRWYAPDLEGDGEGPAAEWLKAARVVDRGARTLIRWCLAKATEAAGESEVDWLAAAATLAATDTLELVVIKKMQLDAEKINGLSDPKSRAEKQLLAGINGHLDALAGLASFMKSSLNK